MQARRILPLLCVALVLFFARTPVHATFFSVDFNDPPYNGVGFPAILGQDGWTTGTSGFGAEAGSNWIQSADVTFGSGQVGAIGFRTPPSTSLAAGIGRSLTGNPVAEGNLQLIFSSQLRVVANTPAFPDLFAISFVNSADEVINSFSFNMAAGLFFVNGSGNSTTFSTDTNYDLYVTMDFDHNLMDVSLDGGATFAFQNETLNGFGAAVNDLTSLDIIRFGTDTNSSNYLLMDDLAIVPEPTTGALLLGGSLMLLLRRRK